jgi:tetratricopeptide (TPR) repeat protein
MKTPNWIILSLTAAAVVCLWAAAADAQYYTPLRYDLRFTSPTYIPSGTLRFGPADKPDPYAFGAPQYGNLGITGNLRAGKSFHGNVPYGQVGSQLSSTLPSLSLSRFQRDSFGIADLGTGVEYGIPEAYIPSSGAVTNIYTAGNRFAVPPPGDRAPYVPPNVNAPVMGFRLAPPSGGYVGSNVPEGTPIPPGVSPAEIGMAVPQSAVAWVDALIAGRVAPPATLAEIEKAKQQDKRLGLLTETPDLRIGIQPETPAEETAPPEPGEPKVKLPPTPGPFRPASTYPVYLDRARAAMKDGSYDQAEAFYAAAVALEPNQPDAFFGRVYAILGVRNYLQASVVLQAQLLKHATWLKVTPDLRSAYPKPEIYDRIIVDVKNQLETEPANLNYNFLLGYVYFAGGDNALARPCLAQAAKLRGAEKQGPETFILIAMEGRKGR